MPSPPFITFEGLDNSGKTTQMSRIVAWLRERGTDVVATREPGGSPQAEQLRHLLVSPSQGWHPLSALLLFSAARNEHLHAVIKPALEKGAWVLCDRFIDSTYAYQGAGEGIAKAPIDAVSQAVVGTMMPTRTFIFDMPAEHVFSRPQEKAEARYETAKDLSFFQRVREGLLARAAQDKQRCVIIDATQPIDTITQDIQTSLKDYLS
ncbi:MAG: dTMP kinase [Alphaproteobacteria bacterium GM202ARS2]|nr:dTMP kinase [Alphaproteobacteria bacterium GM202ARS2]